VFGRERVERQDVVFGVLQQPRELRQPDLQLHDGVTEATARFSAVGGREELADQSAEGVVLVLAAVASQVSEEVHGAALPRRPEDPRDRRLQPGMGVADDQLHADEAAGDEAAEELRPERFGLGLADVQADDLSASGLVHGVGDHDALARDAAAVADLLDLRVDEHVGVAALQRPLPERLDLPVEQAGDPADLAAADPQPETLDELINTPRRHTADVRLLHHRHERLLERLRGCRKLGK
jgi:hypothetical protein